MTILIRLVDFCAVHVLYDLNQRFSNWWYMGNLIIASLKMELIKFKSVEF